MPRRAAALLAGIWAGLIAAIGFVAAPVLFATLPSGDAGHAAAHLFRADAAIGLGLGALLLVLALQQARRRSRPGSSRFSAEMVLVLVALFCIVAGHYAIEPMLGRGDSPSFAVLHGVASAFFVVKFVAVVALAWRLVDPGTAAADGAISSAAPSS
ncbi:MAG TPA: DUF4149 domain-containing protein [Caldimonas sp.]